ncbi:MAG: hypothetical protein ACHQUB_03395, partial [Candidatus Saccharimonadia bacterium]
MQLPKQDFDPSDLFYRGPGRHWKTKEPRLTSLLQIVKERFPELRAPELSTSRLSICLTCLLGVSAVNLATAGAQVPTTTPTTSFRTSSLVSLSDQPARAAAVNRAEAQFQLGKNAGTYESPNITMYIGNPNITYEEWCADFVSWATDGLVTNPKSNNVAVIKGSIDYWSNSSTAPLPEPGDYIFVNEPGGHIGIVAWTESHPDYFDVYYYAGNEGSNGRELFRDKRTSTDPYILGFGRPNYIFSPVSSAQPTPPVTSVTVTTVAQGPAPTTTTSVAPSTTNTTIAQLVGDSGPSQALPSSESPSTTLLAPPSSLSTTPQFGNEAAPGASTDPLAAGVSSNATTVTQPTQSTTTTAAPFSDPLSQNG